MSLSGTQLTHSGGLGGHAAYPGFSEKALAELWRDASTNTSTWAHINPSETSWDSGGTNWDLTGNVYETLYDVTDTNWTTVSTSKVLGETWEVVTSGTANGIRSIYYSRTFSKWFACGDSGTILSSRDGANWDTLTSGTTLSLRTVKEFKGELFIVGYGDLTNPGTVLSSTDGINWISVDIGGAASHLVTIDFSDDLMIFGGWHVSPVTALLVTSTDGEAFTRVNHATFAGVYGVKYANGVFNIVGTSNASDTVEYAATTTDGVTLTTYAIGMTYAIYSIDHDGTNWVAGSGNGVVKYSSNLSTWTNSSTPPLDYSWRISNNGIGTMILCGGSSGRVFISKDSGVTFTQQYTTALQMNKAWYDPNMGCWVAVGQGGVIIRSRLNVIYSG